jgi:hypothetical protein
MEEQKYAGCWYCDNIIDHPDQVGLLYLGFPRCFVLIPSSKEFYFSTYKDFINGASEINWLDPKDICNYSEYDKEKVLTLLWNFSVEQEAKDEELYNKSNEEDF